MLAGIPYPSLRHGLLLYDLSCQQGHSRLRVPDAAGCVTPESAAPGSVSGIGFSWPRFPGLLCAR